jgi:hypothetical protein
MTRHRRQTMRCLLPAAVALALAAPAAAAAAAQQEPTDGTRAALATERYYSSYADPPPATDAALAAERYYSSYGTPQPRAVAIKPPPVTAAGGHGPGWSAAIGGGALAMLVAAGLGVIAGRATNRPRHVRA